MAKDLALILNSGGINSAVVTALAVQKYRPIIVYADAAGKTKERCRAAVDQQVAFFKPYREYSLTLPVSIAGPFQQSSTSADPRQASSIAPELLQLLPLLAVGVRLAVQHEAARIYLGTRIGPKTDELAQATEFFQIWNEMIQLPCGQTEMEIETPLLELEPWQVVDLGFQVAAPLDKTRSCDEESAEPCWSCSGCRARQAAFEQAAKPDPLRPRK
jgi:7-cyano-7-deazaguanine synthase